LGAPQYRLLRYGGNTAKRKAEKQSKISETGFPRNLTQAFAHHNLSLSLVASCHR
jgi:hypothetical protein